MSCVVEDHHQHLDGLATIIEMCIYTLMSPVSSDGRARRAAAYSGLRLKLRRRAPQSSVPPQPLLLHLLSFLLAPAVPLSPNRRITSLSPTLSDRPIRIRRLHLSLCKSSAMGASQSKLPESQVHEQLLERLRALDLKNRQALAEMSEKDYVVIDKKAAMSQRRATHDISISSTQQWEKELLADPKNRLALAAFTNNPAASIISSNTARVADVQNFNIKIPIEGSPVTNQRSSGRCWLFASTNVFRIALMKKHDLKSFELSQAYLFFWDQLEKANYFLENILETVDEPLDGRLLQTLLGAPVGDGGQWDMVANLVEKYGLVPHSLYPDSFNAMNSSAMGSLIRTKLREDAIRLRDLANSSSCTAASISAAKESMMREIHLILTLMLGPPPKPDEQFEWEHYNSDGKYAKIVSTPLKFASELQSPSAVRACAGTNVHRLFSLVNDPRNEYETLLSVDRLGNVWNARPVTYVNSKISTMKKAAITQLQKGIPVFFGSDVGKFSDSGAGIMDLKLFDYELGFNVRLGMSKAERLMASESAMTHAMVLTAVHVEDGKSVRWRVENSWSESAGDKGYFVMLDSWFDEFVYQVVVDPSFVAKETRDVLKMKPKVLPLWDPMGALA